MLVINGQEVGFEVFPNGETIMRDDVIIGVDSIVFELRYEADSDLTALMFYKKYFDEKYPKLEKWLNMLYVPYSRMDRKISGFIFSLKYFCQFINDLKFDVVVVLDVHSGITTGLLDRCREINIQPWIDSIVQEEDVDCIFYPDNGALKRYTEILTFNNKEIIYGNKKRNLQTGNIEKFEVVGSSDLTGKTVLIVDDLCSRGGTFMASAKALRELGAKRVILYVSHCENTIHSGELLNSELINKVYTTDSIIRSEQREKITLVI